MMTNLIKALPLLFVFALAGCEQEGPAENVGENLDNAAENVGEGLEEGTENLEEGVEQ